MSYGMFRLPLLSSMIGGNKVTATEDVKVLATPEQKPPVMESVTIHNNLKRKRADSSELNWAVSAGQANGNATRGPVENTTSPSAEGDNTSTNRNGSASLSATPSATVSTQATSPERPTNPPLSLSKKVDSPSSANNTSSTSQDGEEELASNPLTMPKSVDLDALRQTLEAQLSLEILLKHDELRLIDTEIAKCQVALEQLRRCSEIPFPGSNTTGPSLSVSNGVGFALRPSGSGRLPSSPAPWGVTDGPYTRHYSRWLLPDPRFDGGEPDPGPLPAAGAGKSVVEGRTTRASWNESGGPVSRSQRSSTGAKLQALSSGYPPPKDKAGPMIMKRKSDGQWVKLVCIDCRRDNFSSTQGFINHCRIAHNRSFASHDAAALACGEPVEVDETGAIVGKGNESSNSGPPGYVHPLIRSAHSIVSTSNTKTTPPRRKSTDKSPSAEKMHKTEPVNTTENRSSTADNLPSRRPEEITSSNPSFKAAPQTPHLSSFVKGKGIDLDLLKIVDDALTKTDMDMYSSGDDSDDDAESESKMDKTPSNARGSRLPTRTVASSPAQRRPGSQKGADKGGRKPHSSVPSKPPSTPRNYTSSFPPQPSSLASSSQMPHVHGRDMMEANLSPDTLESNQAPSLVSDDGEYGARSEFDSPSPSSSESHGDEIMFDNVEVQDSDDGNESTTTGSPVDVAAGAPGKQRPPTISKARAAAKFKKQKISAKNKLGADTLGSTSNNDQSSSQAGFVTPGIAQAVPKKGNAKRQRRK
ncbi:hypothetical protein VTO42DRAFT_7878 [Malbranchea cinnamomea]